MNIYLLQDIPNEMKIELVSDDTLTNLLLVLNIIVTLIVSFGAANYIQRKIKFYEVKAHKDKIVTEKKINFCLEIQKTFKLICAKNPKKISSKDFKKINSLKISEHNIFLSKDIIEHISDFGDYIINISQNSELKDIKETEKFFFHKLREYIKS
jgi:hypothetical protein